jgi:hypothetical protein
MEMVGTVRAILSVLVATTLLAGWGSLHSRAAAAQTAAHDSWAVTLHVTGGFAGVRQQLEVDHTGQVKAVDEKLGRTSTGRMKASQLQELGGLVLSALADNNSSTAKRKSACADCYSYVLVLTGQGRTITRNYDNLTIIDSGDYGLVHELLSLMRQHLSPARSGPSCQTDPRDRGGPGDPGSDRRLRKFTPA